MERRSARLPLPIGFGEIHADCDRHGLPALGILYFFYNPESGTWGFDPRDRGSWQVFYTDKLPEECSERAAPKGLHERNVYRKKAVAFHAIETYPDWQDHRVASLGMTDSQSDEYDELCRAVFRGCPAHQLFGHPSPVQGNDMDLECQLVANGLNCGDPSCFTDLRAVELEAGRSDWTLLFQLDTDDDTGIDVGRRWHPLLLDQEERSRGRTLSRLLDDSPVFLSR